MTDNDKILIEFLNKCGIVFQHFDNLNGMIIPRDVLISVEKYEKVKEEIKNIVYNNPHYFYDNNGENPYYALLGVSNVALVTPDSVNMVSEAITANLSTYIFDLECKSRRINKFLSKLKEENFIKKINGKIDEFDFEKSNATKEIANHLAKLI